MTLLPYFFLMMATALSLLKTWHGALIAFVLSLCCGLFFASLQPLGLIWIALLVASLKGFTLPKNSHLLRGLGIVSFLLLAVGLSNHLLPGFNNLMVFDKVQFSADSIPFTMYLNFDKTLLGFFICLLFIPMNQRANFGKRELLMTVKVFVLQLARMIPLCLWTGYVRFDPKQPPLAWLWALNNLLLVCVTEEALFRGVVQGGLTKLLKMPLSASKTTLKIGKSLPLLVGAILFGLAHYKGGIIYVAFAALAGVFYGYAYLKTQKIMSSILVHFSFNLVHFLLFSYPALGHALIT